MKKLIAILLTLVLVLSFAACKKAEEPKTDTPAGNTPPETPAEPAMTWAEYQAAELDSEVTVECYVQGAQGWWEDKITVYAQDKDGAYFLYEMACAEEDAVKLVPGTKIRVNGYKAEWKAKWRSLTPPSKSLRVTLGSPPWKMSPLCWVLRNCCRSRMPRSCLRI